MKATQATAIRPSAATEKAAAKDIILIREDMMKLYLGVSEIARLQGSIR